MKIFDTNIPNRVAEYLDNEFLKISFYADANQIIFKATGLNSFFDDQDEFLSLKKSIQIVKDIVEEPDRAEYGDFQTNNQLAESVTCFLKEKKLNPDIIIEPTCGKGNFIIASLKYFPNVKRILGVEIYKPYVWETKFKIIQYYLDNPSEVKPVIEINHYNVFDFDFNSVAKEYMDDEVLVIGNPPWVTNSKLGSLESNNLPKKSNFKKHTGFDAMTGKGNFDIGEFITLMMFDAFQYSNGHFAFLVKNSVVKNVVFDQKQRRYTIADMQKLTIDSKKEFNVSVEAALMFCRFNSSSEFICSEYNFYNQKKSISQFGWVADKFVSNVDTYIHSQGIDKICPFEWRQGIKHDLASIMELEKINGHYVNGLNQEFSLEDDLVFAVLKSSDLKQPIIKSTRKFTIVTQRKIGQDTSFIEKEFPKTFKYLFDNKARFDSRKSSIYNNKPDFSIFGIGDYSFAPYKISISGLYKTFTFSLVLPINNKPVMLDDTCYLIAFDQLEYAVYTLILLNSEKTKALLQSITFPDAKRTFTKDVLMRIDLYNLALQYSDLYIRQELEKLNDKYQLEVSINLWSDYVKLIQPAIKVHQLNIFA